ncbi:MAG: carbohydrate kinase, partial [Clostridia bacterium]|nr:carbohydrate kinase [Clostridia bacterium]
MFENHDPVMLTFDCGTQSIRALLFTAEGNIIDKEKIVFEPTYFSKKPGWAEQEPEFYFDKLCE